MYLIAKEIYLIFKIIKNYVYGSIINSDINFSMNILWDKISP